MERATAHGLLFRENELDSVAPWTQSQLKHRLRIPEGEALGILHWGSESQISAPSRSAAGAAGLWLAAPLVADVLQALSRRSTSIMASHSA